MTNPVEKLRLPTRHLGPGMTSIERVTDRDQHRAALHRLVREALAAAEDAVTAQRGARRPTDEEITRAAVRAALDHLLTHGLITVVPGHTEAVQ